LKKYNLNKIKIIATDIDGVLTDGHSILDAHGNEQKRICFRDLDAVAIGRKMGLDFILITGEANELVTIISKRFSILKAISNVKDKLAALNSICESYKVSLEQICYVGDSERDSEAILNSGFGVAPFDASKSAKKTAVFITESKGGDGVLAELIELFAKNRE
jgi:3-deoxy-D-manno-octulosonate 8-phosphate phosphatase (KDO 8-P phosphatase)